MPASHTVNSIVLEVGVVWASTAKYLQLVGPLLSVASGRVEL